MSAGKQAVSKKARQDRRTNIINLVLVAIFVLGGLALLCHVRGWTLPMVHALETDGYEMDAVTFNYFYRDCYDSFQNAYGEMLQAQGRLRKNVSLAEQEYAEDYSWAQFFYDTAVQNAERTVTVWLAAQEAGYELPEEELDAIDAQLETIRQNARANGFNTGEGFLRGHYGRGSSLKSYRDYLVMQAVADGFSGGYYSGAEYTDAELSDWFAENYPDAGDQYDYATVNIRMIYLPFSGYELDAETGMAGYSAQTRADTLSQLQAIEALYRQGEQTEASFAALAEEYSAYNRGDGGLFENVLKDDETVEAPVRRWVFAEGRAPGDVGTIEADSGAYLLYWIGEDVPARDHLAQKGLRTEAWNAWYEELAASAEFTENPNILKHLYLTA